MAGNTAQGFLQTTGDSVPQQEWGDGFQTPQNHIPDTSLGVSDPPPQCRQWGPPEGGLGKSTEPHPGPQSAANKTSC